MQNSGFTKRQLVQTEYVMDLEDGIDMKNFTWQYNQILKSMQDDGVSFESDDAYTVVAEYEQLIFRTQPVTRVKKD